MQQRSRPTAIMLTRQKLAPFQYQGTDLERPLVQRGAYVLHDCAGTPDVVLIGTGSEVQTCLDAAGELREGGLAVRVVSMPSWELFAEQPQAYRDEVLPPAVRARVAVEAGVTQGWCRWVGDAGIVVGIERFGLSAPGDQAAAALGIEAGNVARKARDLVASLGSVGNG